MLTGESTRLLEDALASFPVEAPASEVARHATECVILTRIPDAGLTPWGSRYGGIPDLAQQSDWPMSDAGLLNFFMQINLEQVPRVAGLSLPRAGVLQVFVGDDDLTDVGFEHSVRLQDESATPSKMQPPSEDDLAAPHYADLGVVGIAFRRGVQIRQFGDLDLEELNEACAGAPADEIIGQIGGFPYRPDSCEDAWIHRHHGEDRIDDSDWKQSHRQEIESGAAPWRQLLRIDSEFDHVDASIGDGGSFTVLITSEDLDQSRWDRTWMCRDSA